MSQRSATGRLVWLFAASLLASCANFRHLGNDLERLENAGVVEGEVEVRGATGKPIVVVSGRVPKDPAEAIIVRRAFNSLKPGPYLFRLEAGSYWFGAFEDANEDGVFQDGERGVVSAARELKAGTKVKGPRLVVEQPFSRRKRFGAQPVMQTFQIAAGKELPLDDPRFGAEAAQKGLWQPVLFGQENEPGIYFLQPYDPSRVPVLFVHGMSGYPQEFRALIGRLDRARFQPWVFSYPSGYELEAVGKFLELLVTRLSDEHQLQTLCVVAHSMGGLVTRRFLGLHEEARPRHAVRSLVTINSPLGGMSSAAWGVRMAPEVVPSWYDLAPGSKFLEALYKVPLSDAIEYHLLFAFDDSGESDSVVPLLSQLRVEAQGEAELVRGYRATHTGSLHADAVAAQVLRALDRCAGQQDLNITAPRPREPEVVR